MPDGNGDCDWRERMRRLEQSVERNSADHDRVWANQELMERNLQTLRAGMVQQKHNVN